MNLILVGGIYKSGTSAACMAVEARGYRNPCEATSKDERAHGIAVRDYATRECVEARALNSILLASSPRSEAFVIDRMASYLRDMQQELGPNLVIKDPRMKLTAGAWFRAARLVECETLELVATRRRLQDVYRSLQNARFMRWKMRRQPELFRALARPLSASVIAECRRAHAQVVVSSFSDESCHEGNFRYGFRSIVDPSADRRPADTPMIPASHNMRRQHPDAVRAVPHYGTSPVGTEDEECHRTKWVRAISHAPRT